MVEGERVYIPQCWGGLYDIAGCYCPKPATIKSEIRELEKQLERLREQSKGNSSHD